MSLETRLSRLERQEREEQGRTYADMQADPRFPLDLTRLIGFALRLWWDGKRPPQGSPSYAAGQRLADWWTAGPDWTGEGTA